MSTDAQTNPSTALARVLVDELARGGVTDAVLAPGSRSAPLAMALHDEPRIRLHVRVDERSAAFVALGLGRVTGRPAIVACTSGSAAANLHPAVVEADHGRVPLLVLTADRPPELRGTGANQTIDQLGLYGGGVRWFCDVGVPELRPDQPAYWRSVASRAIAASTATGGPAGPVHLNVALRDPLVPEGDVEAAARLGGRAGGAPWTRVEAVHRPPSGVQIERLARLLAASARGVVVAGGGVDDPAAVASLAARLGWPLLAEPHSGARRGFAAITAYDSLLRSEAFAAAHRPDLALIVGRIGLSKALLAWLTPDVPQVLVDPWPAWPDPGRSLSAVVTASPGAMARALIPDLTGTPGDGGWLAVWQRADAAARQAVDDVLDAEHAPTEPRVARDLARCLPDGAALVVASSMPIRDLDQTMGPRAGLTIHANRGASGIDGFVSTAVGVALAHGGPTVALAGDLSLLHDQNGLLVGDDEVDLVIVVVNNDGGGIFSFLPQAAFDGSFERLFGTPHGVDPARAAQTAGAGHRLVGDAAGLVPAVEAAARDGGVQLVEVRTDREANVRLHARLRKVAAAAVEG
ncbi:2-succinyl-5-enolpyruvyl-6-hydroxy-3-cyclohexene-1-carboxylic-acid synthase [soil metagenome]